MQRRVPAMMRLLRRIAIVVCLGLLAWGAYTYLFPAKPTQQAQQNRPGGFRRGGGNPNDSVPVLAIPARLADVPVYFEGVGTAKALNTVTVRSQVDGKLIKIAFAEGQEVAQGLRWSPRSIRPSTRRNTIRRWPRRRRMKRNSPMPGLISSAIPGLPPPMRCRSSRSTPRKHWSISWSRRPIPTRPLIENAKATLDYTDVVAPLTGLTGIRLVDEGNIVHATDTTGIVVITQIKPISVLFSLPQQESAGPQQGHGQGRAAGASDRRRRHLAWLDTGKVVVINNQVDQTTGTVQLKAEFPNTDLQLWPGQFINVRVLINTLRQVVVVPTAAVQRGPDGTFVYVVKDDNTVAMRPVMIQQQDDKQAVIGSGLQAGERVVTTGFGRLADGSKVEVTSAEDAGQISTNPGHDPGVPRASARKGKGQRQQGADRRPPARASRGRGKPEPGRCGHRSLAATAASRR